MKIEHPTEQQFSDLKWLWKEAFEDDDAFIDRFFQVAFDPQRCFCLCREGILLAAAYWFDVEFSGKPAAYVYAVATATAHRGQGLCRELMAAIHRHLNSLGYAGVMLVPGNDGLREMYGKLGYEDFGGMEEVALLAGDQPITVTQITQEEYAQLRRQYLPTDGVVQEGENLCFLRQFYRFYKGDECLFAAASTGLELFAAELLGNPATAPGILAAMAVPSGVFRMPGVTPYAMYHSLDGQEAPSYFAFAFD